MRRSLSRLRHGIRRHQIPRKRRGLSRGRTSPGIFPRRGLAGPEQELRRRRQGNSRQPSSVVAKNLMNFGVIAQESLSGRKWSRGPASGPRKVEHYPQERSVCQAELPRRIGLPRRSVTIGIKEVAGRAWRRGRVGLRDVRRDSYEFEAQTSESLHVKNRIYLFALRARKIHQEAKSWRTIPR